VLINLKIRVARRVLTVNQLRAEATFIKPESNREGRDVRHISSPPMVQARRKGVKAGVKLAASLGAR
jgi:hypothetical protein